MFTHAHRHIHQEENSFPKIAADFLFIDLSPPLSSDMKQNIYIRGKEI